MVSIIETDTGQRKRKSTTTIFALRNVFATVLLTYLILLGLLKNNVRSFFELLDSLDGVLVPKARRNSSRSRGPNQN